MSERLTPQEQVKTPEKSAEKVFQESLEQLRDTLLAFNTINSFRKGRGLKEMASEEIEQYKTLRSDWQTKKEKSLSSWDTLPEDRQEELTAMGSRLYDVQAKLTLLESRVSETSDETTSDTTDEQAPLISSELLTPETSALTLNDVEDKIARLEKSQSVPLLELEAWKARRVEFQERQDAEANPDRTPPKGFMAKVKDSFDRARGVGPIEKSRMSPLGLQESTPSQPEQEIITSETEKAQPETVEDNGDRIKEIDGILEEERRALHQGIDVMDRNLLEEKIKKLEEEKSGLEKGTSKQKEAGDKEPKKSSAWGFLKERARGLITPFGFREFSQAEILRRKTKEISGGVEALATLIQQENNLDKEEAEKEAWEIVNTLKEQGLTISASEFYEVSKDITEHKRKENDEEIAYIIKSTEDDIYDKLQKYRGQSGQDILTRENQLAIRTGLMGELNNLRDGAFRKDLVSYAKLMRRNLDDKWRWRYVWGGIDALAWLGVGLVSLKFLTGKGVAEAAAAAASGAGGVEKTREFIEQGMHKNIWSTLEQMAKNGPGHFTPTGEQLKEWSQGVLDSIKHYEPEWINNAVEGLKSSRTMPEGFPLRIPVDVMKEMQYPGF